MNPPSGSKSDHDQADPGRDMNVRHVHAGIWREFAEPREIWRRTPWVLRHFYSVLFIWLIVYLFAQMGDWKWSEYEENSIQRMLRENARSQLNSPQMP